MSSLRLGIALIASIPVIGCDASPEPRGDAEAPPISNTVGVSTDRTAADPLSWMRLDGVDSVRLPSDFVPAGSTLATNGSVVAWSDGKQRVLVLDESLTVRWDIALPSELEPVAVGWRADQTLAVLASEGATSHRIAPDGTILESTPIADGDGTVWAATLIDGEWIALRASDYGASPDVQLVAIRDEGTVRVIDSLPPFGGAVNQGFNGPVIMEAGAPYRVAALDGDGNRLVMQPWDDFVAGLPKPPATASWTAVSALRFEDGYLQQLNDGGGWIVLILYDPVGRPYKHPVFGGRFLFFAADPEEKVLYTLAERDGWWIIRKRWRWVAG